MRVIYSLLTQVIIIIGRIRDNFFDGYTMPSKICAADYIPHPEQVCMNGVSFVGGACCDCGAHHYYWVEGDIFFACPIRPKNYNYKPRFFDLPATRATKEMLEKMNAFKESNGK